MGAYLFPACPANIVYSRSKWVNIYFLPALQILFTANLNGWIFISCLPCQFCLQEMYIRQNNHRKLPHLLVWVLFHHLKHLNCCNLRIDLSNYVYLYVSQMPVYINCMVIFATISLQKFSMLQFVSSKFCFALIYQWLMHIIADCIDIQSYFTWFLVKTIWIDIDKWS